MIEKAIYICSLSDLKFFNKNFKRIYFGIEFCERLLPTVKEIEEVLKFCRAKNVNFTLILPWCTEKTIHSVEKIFKILPPRIEVVFNDWGIWKLMDEQFGHKNFKYVLGRILVRSKSDPRVSLITDKKKLDYTRQSVLNNVEFQNFIIKRGVRQVELNNTLQGYNFRLEYNISTSIYYPYVFSSVTTRCIFKKNINIVACEHGCKNKYIICKIRGNKLSTPIYVRGNYEFYKNDKIPSNIDLFRWHVNRIVYMPHLTL